MNKRLLLLFVIFVSFFVSSSYAKDIAPLSYSSNDVVDLPNLFDLDDTTYGTFNYSYPTIYANFTIGAKNITTLVSSSNYGLENKSFEIPLECLIGKVETRIKCIDTNTGGFGFANMKLVLQCYNGTAWINLGHISDDTSETDCSYVNKFYEYHAIGSDLPTWLYGDWQYRKEITLDSSAVAENATGYQIKINVTYEDKMNTNFSDLRFTYLYDNGLETDVPYMIEDKVDSSWALVWLKIPKIYAGSNQTVYMYYGNPNATSKTTTGDNIFEFYDDFNTLDNATWVINSTDYLVNDGVLRINRGGIRTNDLPFNLSDGYLAEAKMKWLSASSVYGGTLTVTSAQDYTQPSNLGSDATILYMRKSGLPDVGAYIGNGSDASYNVASADTVFISTADVWYVLGEGIDNSTGIIKLFKDYTEMKTYSTNVVKPMTKITLGYFAGSNTTDIQDTFYDWVRVRKFLSPEPTEIISAPKIRHINMKNVDGYIISIKDIPEIHAAIITNSQDIVLKDGTINNSVSGYLFDNTIEATSSSISITNVTTITASSGYDLLLNNSLLYDSDISNMRIYVDPSNITNTTISDSEIWLDDGSIIENSTIINSTIYINGTNITLANNEFTNCLMIQKNDYFDLVKIDNNTFSNTEIYGDNMTLEENITNTFSNTYIGIDNITFDKVITEPPSEILEGDTIDVSIKMQIAPNISDMKFVIPNITEESLTEMANAEWTKDIEIPSLTSDVNITPYFTWKDTYGTRKLYVSEKQLKIMNASIKCSSYLADESLFLINSADEEDPSTDISSSTTFKTVLKLQNGEVTRTINGTCTNKFEIKNNNGFNATGVIYTLSISYNANKYAQRNFYKKDVFGTTLPINFTLLLLNETKANKFIFKIVDEDQKPVPNYIIYAKRYYQGEDIFRTVESGITSDSGEYQFNLQYGDVYYQFEVYDPNGNLVKQLTPMKIPIIYYNGQNIFTYQLNKISIGGVPNPFDVGYNVVYDSVAKKIVVTFDSNRYAPYNVKVIKESDVGDLEICDINVTGSTGVESAVCPITDDRANYRVLINGNPLPKAISYVKLKYAENVNQFGIILLLLTVGFVIVAGLVSRPLGIVMAVVLMVFSYATGLLPLDKTGLGAFIGLAILLIWRSGR